jgi:hypothetical protein
VLNILKKILFWNYPRNTWQWDALCVVILIFIFLTPKSWFENGERLTNQRHQTPYILTLLVGAEGIENERDTATVRDKVRALTGRSDVQILEVRKRVAQNGTTVGYEVDIR